MLQVLRLIGYRVRLANIKDYLINNRVLSLCINYGTRSQLYFGYELMLMLC